MNSTTKIIITAALALFTLTLSAQTAKFYVKDGGAGNQDGSSWDDAFGTLEEALAEATANGLNGGDTIWIAAGTYSQTGTYYLTDEDIEIYGSFKGTETSINQRTFATADSTILDANGGDYSVFNLLNRTKATVIDGVRITGANFSGYGAGMFNSNSSPTLTNVTINGNTALGSGAGMYNSNSSPTLTNVTISENTTSIIGTENGGGGMFNNNNSSPTLTNVTISGNTTTGNNSKGGGMLNNNSMSFS